MMLLSPVASIFSLSHFVLFTINGFIFGLIFGILFAYIFIITYSLYKKFKTETQESLNARYQVAASDEKYFYDDHFYIKSKPLSVISSKENIYFEFLLKR